MTPRPTPEQVTAARELLAAVAARLGASFDGPDQLSLDGFVIAARAGERVCADGVAGFDGHTVVLAMPAAFRTPNGKPSQVWEIVGFIAERMAERVRRAPGSAGCARPGRAGDPDARRAGCTGQ